MIRALAIIMALGGYAHAADIYSCEHQGSPTLQIMKSAGKETAVMFAEHGPYDVFTGSDAMTIEAPEGYIFFKRTKRLGWYQEGEWKEIQLTCRTTHKDGRRLKGDHPWRKPRTF